MAVTITNTNAYKVVLPEYLPIEIVPNGTVSVEWDVARRYDRTPGLLFDYSGNPEPHGKGLPGANTIGRAQRPDEAITIAASATVSSPFDARGYVLFGLRMPDSFTGASLSFQVSVDNETYQDLYDTGNSQVTINVVAGRSYDLPAELAVWPYWKVVSASVEAADRALQIVAKG